MFLQPERTLQIRLHSVLGRSRRHKVPPPFAGHQLVRNLSGQKLPRFIWMSTDAICWQNIRTWIEEM